MSDTHTNEAFYDAKGRVTYRTLLDNTSPTLPVYCLLLTDDLSPVKGITVPERDMKCRRYKHIALKFRKGKTVSEEVFVFLENVLLQMMKRDIPSDMSVTIHLSGIEGKVIIPSWTNINMVIYVDQCPNVHLHYKGNLGTLQQDAKCDLTLARRSQITVMGYDVKVNDDRFVATSVEFDSTSKFILECDFPWSIGMNITQENRERLNKKYLVKAQPMLL